MDKIKKIMGFIMIILASILYGTLPLGISFGHDIGLVTEQIVIYRFIFSLPCIIIAVIILNKGKLNYKAGVKLMVVGGLGYGLTAMLLSKAYAILGTAPATIIHFSYPAVIMSLEFLFLQKRISKGEIGALFMVILALLLLLEYPIKLDGYGLICAVVSAFTYAGYIFFLSIQSKIKSVNPIERTFWILIGGTIFFVFRYGFINPEYFFISSNQIVLLIATAVFQTLLPVLFLILGLKYIRASVAGIIGALEPFTALLIGAIYFEESLIGKRGISAIFILLSVIWIGIVNLKEEKNACINKQ